MAYYHDANERGYTRGGLDVITAVNLFFKGILLFPVFLLAGYIGVIMMKHMIFQGIPSITAPTQEQRQRIHDRNQEITPAPVELSSNFHSEMTREEPEVLSAADIRAKQDTAWLNDARRIMERSEDVNNDECYYSPYSKRMVCN